MADLKDIQEDAIEALKNIKAAYISNRRPDIKDIHKLDNALMRNNPKSPIVRPSGDGQSDQIYCPECQNVIEFEQEFCDKCGQKIKYY